MKAEFEVPIEELRYDFNRSQASVTVTLTYKLSGPLSTCLMNYA